MNYSKEYKDSILRRMLPPNSESIPKIAREEGISEQTLRNWQEGKMDMQFQEQKGSQRIGALGTSS